MFIVGLLFRMAMTSADSMDPSLCFSVLLERIFFNSDYGTVSSDGVNYPASPECRTFSLDNSLPDNCPGGIARGGEMSVLRVSLLNQAHLRQILLSRLSA